MVNCKQAKPKTRTLLKTCFKCPQCFSLLCALFSVFCSPRKHDDPSPSLYSLHIKSIVFHCPDALNNLSRVHAVLLHDKLSPILSSRFEKVSSIRLDFGGQHEFTATADVRHHLLLELGHLFPQQRRRVGQTRVIGLQDLHLVF